jgi:hypothetical protein
MTDTEFLDDLERRCKKKCIIVLGDEMDRLYGVGIQTKLMPPSKPCTKPAVVMKEVQAARTRLVGQVEHRLQGNLIHI